jgi:ribosomal protein L34E
MVSTATCLVSSYLCARTNCGGRLEEAASIQKPLINTCAIFMTTLRSISSSYAIALSYLDGYRRQPNRAYVGIGALQDLLGGT